MATCTVRFATTGLCGRPAVYVDPETGFAECAEHAADPIALAKTRRVVVGPAVGDKVTVHRYGKEYTATVTRVGARGAVYATFTYDNGAERTVRV